MTNIINIIYKLINLYLKLINLTNKKFILQKENENEVFVKSKYKKRSFPTNTLVDTTSLPYFLHHKEKQNTETITEENWKHQFFKVWELNIKENWGEHLNSGVTENYKITEKRTVKNIFSRKAGFDPPIVSWYKKLASTLSKAIHKISLCMNYRM